MPGAQSDGEPGAAKLGGGNRGRDAGVRRLLALVVGDETVASTRHRVLGYLDALRGAGIRPEVRFEPAYPAGPISFRLARLLELLAATRPVGADLVLVHRRTFPPLFARRLARSGAPMVWDLDDALDLPPPSVADRPGLRRRYRRNFEATAEVADLAVCGNLEIAGRLPHERFEILPTPVDTRRFHPDALRRTEEPVLGWVGHGDNLSFLESLVEPLREVARRVPGLRLIVVADRPPRLDGVEVEFRRWTLESELSCFEGIRVGLMPLQDTPWTRAKCSFKLLQYMALGMPVVASPVGMNREVVSDGATGLTADGPQEWADAMTRLLVDVELAHRLAQEGRRLVERRFDVAVLAPRFVSVLEHVLDARVPSEGPAREQG